MTRPEIDPRTLPEWLQRDVREVRAERRQILFWRGIMGAIWLGTMIAGLFAWDCWQ